MDFDDFDEPSGAAPAAAPRAKFAPRAKNAPKAKLKQPAKAEEKVEPPEKEEEESNPAVEVLPPTPVVVVKKEEESKSGVDEMDVDGNGDVPVVASEEMKDGAEASGGDFMVDLMMEEKEEEEDYVVAEYDVYFTPRDHNTQVYVMQYPLRPSWRPYDLEQRCTEVRVRPGTADVEVDLSIEVDSDNFDPDSFAARNMTKQTLSSSGRPPQAAGYAVGVLTGKKLYLNPIDAVVQLRPSMEFLDYGVSKKKNPNVATKEEGGSNEVLAGPSRKQNKQMCQEVNEPWIPLKYHSSTTDLSQRYLRRMVTEEHNALQFSMNPYHYLNSLCPGAVINKIKSNGPSVRTLLSLPLEERLKTWLIEGPSVQRFRAIKHLAPDDPVADVFRILQQYAHLVQGLWVAKTTIRHPKAPEIVCIARDYALYLFSKNEVFKDSELDVFGSKKSQGKTVIREIAIERTHCNDWKLKESRDVSFIKLYPDVAEHEMKLWQARGERMNEMLSKQKEARTVKISRPSLLSVEGTGKVVNGASMSRDSRQIVSRILRGQFQLHKVFSFQAICQGLRDAAVKLSGLPKADPTKLEAFKSAINCPPEELHSIIREIAIDVNGVYVLRSSSESQDLDPLRNVVIDLFRNLEPGAKLRSSEIMEAARSKLGKEPSDLQKVLAEFCVSQGGDWALKSGDWKPKR